ncbi:fimbrillin family protein [uncultured Bacteroides sp.]|uniref:fimbrillin family protein n=1 Tax=uncultured Bacteroides sp. TaxID=162156 RepID=UPI0025EBEA8A|nr:fimbrillin family protein [uncultured Bacteroides sp.]
MKKTNRLPELIAATALLFAGCSNDEVVNVYQGEAISFNTRVSTRATVTTLANLNAFKVYADAPGYDEMFIDGAVATKEEGSQSNNHYQLLNPDGTGNYYWPSNINSIRFWAYGPAGNADEKDDFKVDKDATTINAGRQELANIVPEVSLTEGGKTQKDLVLAYSDIKRNDATGMRVPLKFVHALSQINVTAKNGNNAGDKLVYIKGAWLMQVHGQGTMIFAKTKDPDTTTPYPEIHENWMHWKPATNIFKDYGIVKSNKAVTSEELGPQELLLGSSDTPLIGGEQTENGSSTNLMLIPQQRNEYKFEAKDQEKQEGAYILLLCRVVAKHPGAFHPEGEDVNAQAGTKAEDAYHYHQLFPVNNEGKINPKEFGYTCVPIEINWLPGKKYTYKLTFCGKNSGAGVYPPDLPADWKPLEPDYNNDVEIVYRPEGAPGSDSDKKPGDPVLDQPITFEVAVTDWVTTGNPEEDKPTDMK